MMLCVKSMQIKPLKMDHKSLGIIIVIFGGLALFSEQDSAWIVSSISIGIGTGIFIWKDKKNNIDN